MHHLKAHEVNYSCKSLLLHTCSQISRDVRKLVLSDAKQRLLGPCGHKRDEKKSAHLQKLLICFWLDLNAKGR